MNKLAQFGSTVPGAAKYWRGQSHLILREFLDEAFQCRTGK
jgi:hypothetical protein